MRALSWCVAAALCASPVYAQPQTPMRAPLERAVVAAAQAAAAAQPAAEPQRHPAARGKSPLFWTGLAAGVAGVTTTTLGLTALRTERTSTGNAPDGTYLACVALRDSNPVYASSQCGALKGKNLKLLWGGVALGGAGAVLMITGHHTSAQISPGTIGIFHQWQF